MRRGPFARMETTAGGDLSSLHRFSSTRRGFPTVQVTYPLLISWGDPSCRSSHAVPLASPPRSPYPRPSSRRAFWCRRVVRRLSRHHLERAEQLARRHRSARRRRRGTHALHRAQRQARRRGHDVHRVTSTGTLASQVRLYADEVTGTAGLADHLALTIEQGTGGGYGTCTGFTAQSTVFDGSLAGFTERTPRSPPGPRPGARRERRRSRAPSASRGRSPTTRRTVSRGAPPRPRSSGKPRTAESVPASRVLLVAAVAAARAVVTLALALGFWAAAPVALGWLPPP